MVTVSLAVDAIGLARDLITTLTVQSTRTVNVGVETDSVERSRTHMAIAGRVVVLSFFEFVSKSNIF